MGNFESKDENNENIKNLIQECLNSPLGTVISTNLDFNREHIVYLAEVLPHNKTIKVLDFEVSKNLTSNYILEEDGASLLSQAIKYNNTITTINLTRNFIREEGAKSLAEGLKKNSSITSLNLTENIIGDIGLEMISKACRKNSITILKLSGNNITSVGIYELSKIFKSKQKRRPLTILDLSNNEINSEGAKILVDAIRFSYLKSLNLSNNEIRNDGAIMLADALIMNSTLTELNLSSNYIEEDGALALSEALPKNSSLLTLLLSDNQMKDNGIIYLSKSIISTNIQYLSFSKNILSDISMNEISNLLTSSKTLISFDLSENYITDNAFEQLANVLTFSNQSLTSLNISQNPLSERSVVAILNCLRVNFTLDYISGFQGTSGLYKIPLALDENKRYKELGYTPLMKAVINNDEAMIRLLLQYGFEPSIRSLDGKLALDFATSNSIKTLLLEAMSSTQIPITTNTSIKNNRNSQQLVNEFNETKI